jgi:hypothetical protein
VLDHVSLSHLQKQLSQENQMSNPDSFSSDEMDNVPLSELQCHLRNQTYTGNKSDASSHKMSTNRSDSDESQVQARSLDNNHYSSDTESYELMVSSVNKQKKKRFQHKRPKVKSSDSKHQSVNKLLVECLSKIL